MKKGITGHSALILLGTAALLVFGYNLWAYCCGRCSVANFLTLGPFGFILVGLNLAAAGVLVLVKIRRRAAKKGQCCPCGSVLLPDWKFCPSCGDPEGTIRH